MNVISLPKKWVWKKAQDCMDVRDGTHDSPKYITEGYPLVTSKNLIKGKIDFSSCSFISKEDHDAISKRSAVDDGDILYAMIGTIGNPVIVKKQQEFSIKNVALFKFPYQTILNKYVCYFLESDIATRQFNSNSRGGTQKFVSLKNIRELKIPLPPLTEQKQIAAILDAADSLRQKDQQLVEHYTALSQSLFLEMFGDPAANLMGWDIRPLSDLFFVKGGKRLPKGSEYEQGITEHAYIRVKDFQPNSLDTSDIKYISPEIHDAIKKYTITSDDIYISIAGTIGIAGIVPNHLSGANLTENAAKIVAKDQVSYKKEFVSYFLNSSFCQNHIKSKTMAVGVPKLALFRIEELPYIDAPLQLQNQFADRIALIEQQKQQAQSNLQNSEALFNSLLQRAFTGELTADKAA